MKAVRCLLFFRFDNDPNIVHFVLQVEFSGPKQCLGFQGIGNAVDTIKNLVYSIPGFGYLFELVEDAISSIVSKVFQKLAPYNPNFQTDLNFVNALESKINKAVEKFSTAIDHFDNMINFDNDIIQRVDDLIDVIKDNLPDDLLDLDLDLPDAQLPDLGFKFLTDQTIPGLEISGVQYRIPDNIVGLIGAFVLEAEGFGEDFAELFDEGMECEEYKTVPVSMAERIQVSLNIDTSKLGIPDALFNFRICSKVVLKGEAETIEKLNKRFGTTTEEFTGLSISGDVDDFLDKLICDTRNPSKQSWGVAIPMTISPNSFLSVGRKLFLPLFAISNSFAVALEKKGGSVLNKASWYLFWTRYKNLTPFNLGVVQVYNFENNLIIGCDTDGKFQRSLQTGPMGSLSLPIPMKGGWKKSRLAEATIDDAKVSEADYNKFVERADEMADIKCDLEFIEATYKTVKAKRKYLSGFQFKKYEKMLKRYGLLNEIKSYLNKPDYVFKVVFDAGKYNGKSRTNNLRFEKLKKNVKKALRADVSVRTKWQQGFEGDEDNDKAESRYQFWKKTKKTCAGPAKVEKTFSIDGSDPWSFIKSIGFHPTSYSNLFGAGFNFVLKRETISGKLEKDETAVDMAFVGPFPLNYVGAACFQATFENISNLFAKWDILGTMEYFYKLARDRRESVPESAGKTKKSSMKKAVKEAGASDNPFIVKNSLKVEWSFGEYRWNIREEEISQDDSTYCHGRSCLSAGFDYTTFLNFDTKECSSAPSEVELEPE